MGRRRTRGRPSRGASCGQQRWEGATGAARLLAALVESQLLPEPYIPTGPPCVCEKPAFRRRAEPFRLFRAATHRRDERGPVARAAGRAVAVPSARMLEGCLRKCFFVAAGKEAGQGAVNRGVGRAGRRK